MDGKLDGLKILITGGAGGIGSAIAGSLCLEGARLVITGRYRDKLEILKDSLVKDYPGSEVHVVTADLSDAGQAESLPRHAAELLGGLDCVVNNAGMALQLPVEKTTAEIWDRIMAVNARAPFLICREATAFLKKSERPRVINISSVVGYKGYEQQAAYASSKHALNGFTKVYAREVHPLGIRVHLIAPGGVDTPLVSEMRPDIDTSDLILPGEIAELVVFLISSTGRGVVDEINIRRSGKKPWD